MPQSLRGRLLVLLVALAGVGLLIVGTVSYAALRSYLSERVDKQVLVAAPEVYHELDDHGGPGGPGGPPPGGGGGGPRIAEGTYGAAVTADGRVVQDTRLSIGSYDDDDPAPKLPDRLEVSTSDNPKFVDVDAVDGNGRYRLVALSGVYSDGVLVVGVPLGDFDSTLSRLLRVELIVAFAVLAALGGSAWWLVRIGLSPLERMGRTAGAIAAGNYSERVEPATDRTEVGRLGLSLNAMLGQIETAFAEKTASEERLRTFLSDASHELRTPLASIRGYAELMRMGAAGSEADRKKATERIEAEAKRMGVLVEDLLTLARLDEERELIREEVDLSVIVAEATEAAGAASPDRSVTLTASGPVLVTGDAGRLRQVVDNLVRNALTHTPDGTAVELRVARDAARAHLEVRDHGGGLPPGDPAALFERFWRAEAGRERGKAGAGLGLAIVAGIVAAHEGEVTAANAPGGGARFSVTLPLREHPASV
jgi:two-component system OmpR family sensor kinase